MRSRLRLGNGVAMFDDAGNARSPQRDDMIDYQIRARGVGDERVLQVLRSLPREYFLPPAAQSQAYDDQPQPIGFGQTISQPFIVAYMTEKLAPLPGSRALEIGTGSGYQTALLARLTAKVFTIERVPELAQQAQGAVEALGIENVVFRVGDGSVGWPEGAPFDRIMVTAAAPVLPPALRDQLADGGRLVAPIGGAAEQRLLLLERRGSLFVETVLLPCRFVRLIGRQGWPEDGAEST